MNQRIGLSLLFLVLMTGRVGAAPVDLSSWSVIQYEFHDQPDANWSLNAGNTIATQIVNADASILLGDFNLANTVINGSWRVNTSDDDDFMGFVFGYQDRGKYYLFDWKKGTQSGPGGDALVGMTIKVVNKASDPVEADIWPTLGSANVSPLFHNSIPWASYITYDFHLEFHPGQFTIEVRQGGNTLLSKTINDSTYQSGRFGFYNDSQGVVQYQGFTVNAVAPVPEPSTFALFAVGAGVFLLGVRGRVFG